MAAAMDRSDLRVPPTPWWLVLIEGILAIIVGILLWMYPVRAFLTLSVFIGIYWIISGIFDIVSIFFDRRAWGWKLFMGLVGIFAGGYLASQVFAGAVSLALATVWIIGLAGIFYGILGLIRAFQGAGWGAGILGVVSIIFGFFILSNRLASALAIPWMFGFLGIFGGLLAIFGAFALRSAQKAHKAAEVKAEMRAPAQPAAAAPQAEAPSPATRFESVSLETAPVEAVAVAGVAAAAVAAGEEEAEAVEETVISVTEETAVVMEEETGAVAEEAVVVEETRTVVVEETAAALEGSGAEAVVAAAVAADLFAEESGPVVDEASAVTEEAVVVEQAITMTEEAVVVEEETQILEKAETAAEALPAFDIPDVVEIAAAQAGFLKKEIEYVEGIGPAYGAKLKAVGINTPLDLLQKGATRKGRELIAEAAGITITLILKWVNHADLFRLKGVGSEYADLLEAAGVDTVVELAQRNPVNLHNKMVATNEEKNLVRQLPSAAQVEGWVSEAKSLDRVVTY